MMDPISIAMGLAQFAPGVIKYLTGSDKAEQAAGAVIQIAKQVTGQADADAALQAVQADPAAQMAFRRAVLDSETELDKAYLVDRQDARSRDGKLIQAGRHNWRSDILALLAVGGLVLCVYFIATYAEMPERAVNAIMFIAGVLASAVKDVYGFEFGSSRGSRDKDELLARK